MVKPLSAQLADLSVRVKEAEAAAAAAQKEARDKLLARRAQAQADATAAVQKMDRDIKAASDKVVANWSVLKAKVAADMEAWNAKIAQFKHDQGMKRAENHAERLEREAAFAIDSPARRSNRRSRLFSMPSSLASRLRKPNEMNYRASVSSRPLRIGPSSTLRKIR